MEELLDALELEYYTEKRSESAYQMYVTDDKAHLDYYTPLEDKESLGKFFDYPREDVEWFTEEEKRAAAREFEKQFPEEELPHSLEEYKRKTWLVEFVPKPTPERIENAVQVQEQYEQALQNADYEGIQRCLARTRNREIGESSKVKEFDVDWCLTCLEHGRPLEKTRQSERGKV